MGKKNIPAISAVAAANGVPIFSPAMVDSAYGETFLMAKNQGHNVHIDTVKEFDQFVSIGTKTKEVGVVYIGGGVPKDLTQLIAISVSPNDLRPRRQRQKRRLTQRPTRILLPPQIRHTNHH